ncbi:MAG TPA: hypothetical protein VN647_01800 [Nitrospira sp.]|nr:hypothetical protein [Nitrospira sp.]
MRIWLVVCLCVALTCCATMETAALQDLPADWPPLGATKEATQSRLGHPSSQSMMLHDGQQCEVWEWNYGSMLK